MYFNRKNAEQKNWRMIKKGKHFLFGCSLVFAVGASLATQTVHADTASEATVESDSKANEAKSGYGGETGTYEAPATVAEIKPATVEKAVETTQNSKEEPVVATEKAKEAESIQAPEVTEVNNPAALTDGEKAKVAAAVKAVNPSATDVQVQADGSVVVTFADGSTANLSASQTVKVVAQAETSATQPKSRSRRAAGQERAQDRSSEEKDIKFVYKDRTATVNDGVPTQRAKIEYRQLGDYEVVDGKTVATDPSGQGRPVLEWTVTFNEAEYDKMGGYYYFTIPKNVSDPYKVVTEYNNGAYGPRDGWVDGNITPGGSPSAEGQQFIDAGNKLEWRVKNTVGRDYNNVNGLSGVMDNTKKVYVLGYGNNTKARTVTIKYRTVVEDPSQTISYIAGVDSKTGLPRNNWYAISGQYDKQLVSQVDAPKVTPNLTNTSINVPVQTVASTSSTLSGTGVPGATIKLYIDGQEQNIGNVTVDSSGNWTTGELPTALNNNQGDGTTIKPRQTVEVSQVVNGEESSRRTVPVSVGMTTVEPSSLTTNQDAVVAGQKEVTLKVPHDAGIAYMRYTNTAGETAEIPVKRDDLSSAWTSQKPAAATVKSVEKGKFQDTIVLTMADKIAGTEVAAISNVVEGGFSSVADWQSRSVENQAPTIASAVEGNKKTVAQGTQLDLASLVTVADKEDDAQATLGDKVHAEVVSVNGNAATKTVDTNTPGTYTVKYKAVDSQGKESNEVEVTVVVENKTPETPQPQPQPQPQPETPKPAGQAPEIVNDLAGKASTPADVTVKAPAGSTVKLYNKDGVVIGEAVANDQGVATVHPTNSLPEGEITATTTPAGGSESAKSAPITVTKTPTPFTPPGQNNGPYKLQLATNTTAVTVYRGDKLSLTGGAVSSSLRWFNVSPETVGNVKGLVYTQTLRTPTNATGKLEGTVAWDQPLGETKVVYGATGSENATSNKQVSIYRPITVTVLETTKKYDPVTGTKVDIANPNKVSEDEKTKIIDSVKTANSNLPAETQYSVDEKGNLTITYPDGSTDKVAAAYLVNPIKDTTAPDQPVVNTDLTGKAGTKTPVEVTAEPGSTVALYDKDNNKIGEATAGENGKATITPKVDIPAGPVTAKATDAAGNTSVASDPKVATPAADTEAPAKPVVNTDLTGKAGTKTPVEVTAEKGSTVALYDKNNNKIGEATAGENGKATITPKVDIPAGPVTAKATDAAGNTSVASDPKVATPARVNVAPTVEIPYSDPAPDKKEVYLYTGEEADVDITFNDDSGKIKSAALKQGGNRPLSAVDGNPDKQDNQFGYTVTAINSETATPAKIKVTGQVSGIAAERLPKTEDDSLDLVTRFATATDTDGKQIENNATKYVPGTKNITESYKTDPGAVTFVLKAQTKKYDIKTPASADKVTVSDANNVTDKEFEKIKEKVKVEYSQNNPDARLADKKGKEVEDASKVVDKVEKEGNNVVVTYKDGSKDTKPLSEFVNVAPTVELPYSNQAKKEIYVYTGENTDLTFKASDNTAVKDMYVRGPGGIGKDNTADYGFTTGKIENSAVTHGDGTVSGATATIKMTGVTTLKAPNHWTSFVVANDNDNAPSNTDFNALDKNPNATQTPGYVHFIVKSQTDKYDIATPAPADKVEVADPTNVTNDDLDKIKEKLKLEYNKKNDDANIAKDTPVDKNGKIQSVKKDDKGNLVVTYTDGSTDTKPLSEFVTKKPTDADKNEPKAKDQTVKVGEEPKAEDSIENFKGLPEGTTAKFKEPVDTKTPGDKTPTVVVTYPDGSTEEVPVKVTVEKPSSEPTDADKNEPKAKDQTVKVGEEPKAEDSIENFKGLPEGTTAKFKEPVDTKTPGDKTPTVVVTYPDGSTEEVPVKVTVEKPSSEPTDADKNEPKAKDQTVKVGEEPKAEDSIENFKGLPEGTTAKFKEPVDTKTPGDKSPVVVVTYPDGSTEEVPVKVTVEKPSSEPTDADKNEPKAKDQTVKVGEEPKAEDSIENFKGLPEGTTAKFKEPVDTKTPGDKSPVVVVTYPDGSTEEVPVKVTVEKPSSEPTDADKNEPTPKAQTVEKGTTPKAEDSIGNVKDLPKGTTVAFKDPVDTSTPGEKDATVVVTYPDGSKEEVPVKVTVEEPSSKPTDADKNEPTPKAQTVEKGTTPKAEDSIGNVKDLPKGTTVAFKDPVDTSTPGEKDATVVVTYPDGSKEEVPVKVTVEEPSSKPTDADKNEPTPKAQTVEKGTTPKAEDSIGNVKDLPKGTTVAFKDPVDTSTPGEKDATVVVTYPDGSKEEVPVKVTVEEPSSKPTDADKNEPTPKAQTVEKGTTPKAEDSIGNVKDLPKGTTVAFKDPVDTSTPGEKDATVVVTYPDGSKEEVPVKVTVEEPSSKPTDADKNEPTPKAQTVEKGTTPKAEDSIGNVKDLPKGTTVAFKDPVDTSTPGEKDATVVVTYPDGSKEEVPVKVTVEEPSSKPTDADKNEPTPKAQTVEKGTTPKAEDSIGNVKDLPKGTTVAFKDPVDTATPGEKDATVVVTYPDGSTEEVPVKVTVEEPSSKPTDADKNEPTPKAQTVEKGTTPKAEDSIGNVKDLPKGTTVAFKDPVDTATPGEKDATVVVTYPDGSTEEVPVKVTVEEPSSKPTDADKNEPTPKAQTVEKGTTPKAEDSIGNVKDLPKGTTVAFKDPVDTATPGEKDATVVVTYPDGSTEEVPVKVTVEEPSSKPTDADKNEPTPKAQTVEKGTTPKAEDSIGNVKDLPKGTTVAFKDPVDTATPGEKDATVVVTYPDGSTEEVPVKVTVEEPSSTPTDADKNEPTPKAQTVEKGTTPKAEDSIGNVKDLPKGTTVAFKDPVDTATPGEKDATVVVTYPDGSKEEVPVKVTVEEPSSTPTDADKNEPTPKAQTVEKGTTPKAEDSIGNVKDLPKGTTVAFKDPVDTATPGEKDATVVVTYPDGSKEEVPVKVTVEEPSSTPTDADKNEPTPKAQTVEKGTTPKAEDSIGNVKDLPKGTTVAFKDPVDTATPGEKDATVVVTYPDGSKEEVPVKVTVEEPSSTPTDADKNEPTPKAQTVEKGTTPKAEDSIGNVKDLPKGTTVAFKDPVDTATPGEKDATVVVTYPDGSKEEVPVKVTVEEPSSTPTDADKNEPTPKAQTVEKGTTPKAEDSIGNVKDLPKGTTVAFKDPVDTATPGEKDATVVVTYPDGSKEEVPVKVTVEEPSSTPTDADGVKDPAKTPVKDPANLTDAEKAKVADEVKKANPTAKDVEVGKDGTATVTFPDGSTAEIPAAKAVEKAKDATPAKDADGVKDPAKTPVKDPANLTDAEKAKVADEVKKANPTAKDVEVGKDGTATVTFPDGSTAEIPAAKAVEKAKDATPAKDADGVKDPAKTPVKDPANLTDAEKAKVADEVKKANPTAKDVEVGKDGTATVTFPDGSTAEIPAAKAVEKAKDATPAKDADGVKDPAKTPVKDPANLTDAEKAKVADEVKKANPTAKDVEVGKDGTATVTFPDGSTAEIPAAKAVEKAKDATPAKDADGVKDPAKTPVKDPANLTDAEKAKVADEVKKANPTAKDVEVGKDGTATVTFPDGSTAEIPAAKAVEKAKDATPAKDADGVKDPAKTPVKDPANLTDAEKAKVADEVKKANPTAKDVEVGKDGTATVTFPDGSTAEIPAAKAVEKSADKAVKDPSVTPVTDPSNLTDAEKAKVADEVKKSNPTVTDVKVGKDGTTTVTYPDGTTAVIPAAKTVKKSDDKAVKDPSVTPVTDPSNLTDAEKAKVADEVKKSNPTAKDVEVGKDGTTTVTYPDGTTAVIPADKTVKKSADKAVKDPSVTPVTDPSNLTDAEKAKVADEVKKSNPTVTDVKVGKDGTTTVTYPDGTTAVIPADKAVKKSDDKAVKDPSVTPVTDPSNLTDAEKAKVADEVKKSNPTVTDVKVGKDGTTTVTYPDGTTAVIPADKAVKKSDDKAVKDPSVTPATDPSNLTDAEKAKVADEVKKSNPTVTDVKVGKDGTTTVTYPDGTTAVIPADKAVKKSADKAVKDPSVTPVTDPSNLTDAEKAKVADEVKKSNPTVTDVKVGKDGTTTVTYPDGTTAVIPADKAVKKSDDKEVKDPSVTPATDPSNLTDAEKAKVADEVKKSNPTVTDVKVGKDGTTTVTYPDGTTAVIPADKAVKKSSDEGTKDPSVTPVTDPSNLTDAEKAKVADEVKKSNPTVTDVKVGKDGTTTVTYPDGTTAVIPADKAVKKSADKAVKDPSVTPVTDPSNLTDAEKAKVADEVKKSNPTVTDVKVGKDGTTTVTYPDGTTAVIPADKAVKKSADKAVKDPSVTPVTDPSNLTDAEKAKVADEVKKSNPTVTDVKVGKDGTTTVTYPDGTTAVIPADKAVKKSADKAVKDPSVTPVTDPSNLTDAEKAKVADEVKKSNPTVTDVKVGKDGTTTVTYPDGTTAVIPAAKTVKKSADKAVKDPSVTPVTDPSNLTDAEKAKIADEVKKSNPTVTDVKVGKDGTTTVTYPDGTTAVIPADKTVKKSADKAVKDPSVTPVTDPSNLTDAEKGKVAEEVKKSNPTVTDVKVGKDGTTTVTYPDGTTAIIPADKTAKKSADKAVKDPSVTPVTDPSNLTDAEKGKVAEEVKKSNPTVTDVKVGKDGTTTVTYPDGTTAVIPADKTAKKSADKVVKDPSVTPVTDPSNLTDAEKAKIADEVKKSNPTVTDVKVGKDGTTTVTYPDGTTAVIPADKAVKKSADKVVKDPSVTPVTDPSNLTDAEKGKVADEVKKSNPTAKDIKVNNDGSVIVTFEDGTTAVIPADKTVKKSDGSVVVNPAANQDSSAKAPAKKAGAKELPNTGTEQSSASLALALLAAATGGLLFAKKREEEE